MLGKKEARAININPDYDWDRVACQANEIYESLR